MKSQKLYIIKWENKTDSEDYGYFRRIKHYVFEANGETIYFSLTRNPVEATPFSKRVAQIWVERYNCHDVLKNFFEYLAVLKIKEILLRK